MNPSVCVEAVEKLGKSILQIFDSSHNILLYRSVLQREGQVATVCLLFFHGQLAAVGHLT